MPVVIIPLVGSLIAGGLMYVVLGRPLAALTNALNSWLGGMSGASAVILGIILGLMMCSDLGGPINKAAYLFATTNLAVTNVGSLKVMAAVMAAGMVPPLAMALSTTLRPNLYQPAERENGTAAWLLGASFISEGAIPFAAADPLRVIPSMMAGGASPAPCRWHWARRPRLPTAVYSSSSPSTGSGRSFWPSSSAPSWQPCL